MVGGIDRHSLLKFCPSLLINQVGMSVGITLGMHIKLGKYTTLDLSITV